MNAYIESYHRMLEDECLSMYEFETTRKPTEPSKTMSNIIVVDAFIPAFITYRQKNFIDGFWKPVCNQQDK